MLLRPSGDKFRIQDFHDVILQRGALPLDLLEEIVDDYIAERTDTLSAAGHSVIPARFCTMTLIYVIAHLTIFR